MTKKKILTLIRKDNTWHVISTGPNSVLLMRQFGKNKPKAIQFTLTCSKEGVHIEHPNYEFKSTVSHFCSAQKDIRLSLNKTYLTSVIKMLRRIGLWEAVLNKDFLQVNKDNPKSNKTTVNRELKSLLR